MLSCLFRWCLCQLYPAEKQFSIYFYCPSLKAFHYRNITLYEASNHHRQFICLFCWVGINSYSQELLLQVHVCNAAFRGQCSLPPAFPPPRAEISVCRNGLGGNFTLGFTSFHYFHSHGRARRHEGIAASPGELGAGWHYVEQKC